MYLKIILVLIIFSNLNLHAKESKKNPIIKKAETISTKKVEIKVTEEPPLATETVSEPPALATETTSEIKKPFYDENIPLTEDEIILLLKEKHQGDIVGSFINSYPRLIKLTVRVNMDKEIKKIWADTLKDKSRYYIFIAILLLSMAINWAWRRSQSNTMAPFFVKVKRWFFRIFLINFSRVALFVLLFDFELRPIWAHIRNIFEF